MRYRILLSAVLLLACGQTAGAQNPDRRAPTLTPFRSDREFSDYILKFEADRETVRLAALERSRRGIAAVGGCSSSRLTNKGWKRKVPNLKGASAIVTGKVIAATATNYGAFVGAPSLSIGTTAAEDGTYAFQIPADRLGKGLQVRVAARRIGFELTEKTLSISPGDSIQLDFALCPEAVMLQGVVTGVATSSESITNVQQTGVDEGGIVKMHGNHLVVLRRGRLFTVSLAGERLIPSAVVDAFGPGIDPGGTWYDELLVYGDKVVVVGYSYARGGTEIGVFHIDGEGTITHLSSYQLRSNDYYSSRNYASRLTGSKLVFYAPLYLNPGKNPLEALPSMRKWRGSAADPFERIASAPRVYRPARPLDLLGEAALHTVTTCDLATDELRCAATVLVGPPGRVFYVSSRAVYVWVTGLADERAHSAQSMLYRMPLDGTGPRALGVNGSPIDQFSFLESNDDHLNVLVLGRAQGERMWRSERARGMASLLRVPVGSFADGSRSADQSNYRPLPSDSTGIFHDRFVGDHLLYGVGNGWARPLSTPSTLYVVPWNGGPIVAMPLSHRIDRIEPMGTDAVIVGADSANLHFDGVSLGRSPHLAQRFVLENAAQGELRSHGFFYKPSDLKSGVLGLPVSSGGRPGYSHLVEGSASILFLRNVDERFEELGKLEARDQQADDACKASCVDWYGNARPIFAGGRVFALLGYELVEGRLSQNTINEVRRINFAPPVGEGRGR
jgi:hypothetical protein